MRLDELLWSDDGSVHEHSVAEWREIALLALASLADTIGLQLQYNLEGEEFEGGFSLNVGAGHSSLSEVALRGVVGADEWPGVGTHVSAVLFTYVGGQRVAPEGKSHLHFVLTRTQHGTVWASQGWTTDEYGEYGYFAVMPPLPRTLSTTSTRS